MREFKSQIIKTVDMEKRRRYWTAEEDEILQKHIKLTNCDWKLIAQQLDDRNPSQCAQRWKRIKPQDVIFTNYKQLERNNKWTTLEDRKVIRFVGKFGCNWRRISEKMKTRTGRQIRERYINHLDPSISRKKWSKAEDKLVWTLYNEMGTKWSDISKLVPGRPENSVKNRFYSYIRAAYGKISNPYYVVPKVNQTESTELTESPKNNQDTQESELWCRDSYYNSLFNQIDEMSRCQILRNKFQSQTTQQFSNENDRSRGFRSFYSRKQLEDSSHFSDEDQDRYDSDISDNQPFYQRKSHLRK